MFSDSADACDFISLSGNSFDNKIYNGMTTQICSVKFNGSINDSFGRVEASIYGEGAFMGRMFRFLMKSLIDVFSFGDSVDQYQYQQVDCRDSHA